MRELTPSNEALEEILARWSENAHRPVSLELLVTQWSKLVQRVETGYELSLDDYVNDIDSRVMLDEALLAADRQLSSRLSEKLKPLDTRFMAATDPSTLIDGSNRWRARLPRNMSVEMQSQIRDLREPDNRKVI